MTSWESAIQAFWRGLANFKIRGYTYGAPPKPTAEDTTLNSAQAERVPATTAVCPGLVAPALIIPATQPLLEELLSSGARKGSILLVDDDRDIRALLRCVLERDGYRVRTASDGVECVKLAKTLRPDLILLNYLMPVMDGLGALRQIKMNPVISYLKVVMFSGVSDFKRFREAAIDGGAIDCLQSPLSLQTFRNAIEQALRG